ncbi:MAG: hypothetical protein BGO98_21525 [Myxococcales bacterium 68-20]|nr:hypothetical protein [Myxococcales bacterium]OJY28135.1 MAG: hypothetical protein BGO98_21525 [Myxococcales bacterium 68-20]
MKLESVIVILAPVACVCAALGGCASDASTSLTDDPDATTVAPPAPDAGADVDAADAGPCVDCEYFPTTCSSDTLCPNGPFEPNTAGGAFDLRTRINAIVGRSANDVWAIGALGAVAHFDGASWSRVDTSSVDTMRALWLRDSSEVLVATPVRAYARGIGHEDWRRYEADTDYPPRGYDPEGMKFTSGWAAPGGDSLWCATMAWTPGVASGLWRLRLAASGDRFELIDGVPAGTCERVPCSQISAIHGTSPNDIWAVGVAGSMVHLTNAESDSPNVTRISTRTWQSFYGVWAASETEAWAVGNAGVIRHYTGDPLAEDFISDVSETINLNAVAGTSSSDVWAVGDAGVVLHYDGKSWSRMSVAGLGGRRPDLTAVWMSGPGKPWIGGQGVVLSLGGRQ